MNYKINQINNINNINEIDEVEEINNIVVPKRNFYCLNCNKKGHIYKTCVDPIISNGIIAVYVENLHTDKTDLLSLLENMLSKNILTKNTTILDETQLTNINTDIKFLMVQRKHSLGYIEFIRGRYELDNTTLLRHIIEQMIPFEINDILTKEFDYLWYELWDLNNIKNKNHYREYAKSKQKFYQLKLFGFGIFENTKPLYTFNEWGFPKGRREPYESDLVCAIREFEEETNLNETNYILLEGCNYIKENLIGTNNIRYAHNYFIAILNKNLDTHNNVTREIGETKMLNLTECLNLIRPYHTEKIKIITNLYLTINNFLRSIV